MSQHEAAPAHNSDIAVEFVRSLFVGNVAAFRELLHPHFESIISGDLALARRRNAKQILELLTDLRPTKFGRST